MAHSDQQVYRLPRLVRSLAAAACAVAVIGAFHVWSTAFFAKQRQPAQPADSQVDASATESLFSVIAAEKVAAREAQASILATPTVTLPGDIRDLVELGEFQRARSLLLEQATEAVVAEDDATLAQTLSVLGEVSILEEDIDTAEVYLTEALEVFQQLDDEVAEASVYMQFGRLHVLSRQRARRASSAYDSLLIARWKISKGQFYSAEPDLYRIAESNLNLKRFGAAASAYETLFRGYMEVGDQYQAQQAGIEAMKLHASAGRMFDAEALQQRMLVHGIDASVFEALAPELEALTTEFENSVKAIGTARDQALLYNQLQARGDVINAWRFRQQASASLAKATERAQYRSQPDVLAELYRSNTSMEDAHDSLQKARELYQQYGIDTTNLQDLQTQIY
jgi:hypothetical protein